MKKKMTPLVFDTYIAIIKNSVGSNLFRNAFFIVGGKKKDILRDGDLSCAIYVSSVLFLNAFIPEVHATVKGTEAAMEKAHWKKIKKPKKGAVIVWAVEEFEDGKKSRHIGFYIGDHKAISNSSKKRCPIIHHWTFGFVKGQPKRNVEAIYWHSKLSPPSKGRIT
jgi:predicted nucleic acid-binding Zn finger protein